jgi:hypothetical protein
MHRVLLVVLVLSPVVTAQPKKPMPKDQPKVLMATPFGLSPGKTSKLALRGLKLEGAREVRIAPKGSVKLLKKSKVPVPPQQEASRAGDSQVEVEVTLPADLPGETILLTVVTATGTGTHKVLIDRTPPVVEKEPNNGFKTAQAVKVGQTVEGGIAHGQDVDVYRFEGKAGDKVVVEVLAARLGSALDSFLTVYDANGQIVGTSDDIEGSTDSRLELTLARAGVYYASVIDAHDQGGPAHRYRLVIRAR